MLGDEPPEGAHTEGAQAGEAAAEIAPADDVPRRWSRPVRPERFSDRRPIWLDALPSLAQLEADIRRHPLGRTIAAICLDLGIAPRLCTGVFWNRLFEAMLDYRGSLTGMLVELRRRETKFDKEDWKQPRLPLPERTHEGVRKVVGFLIGEEPVDALRPDALQYAAMPYPAATSCPAAAGTGPPGASKLIAADGS